MRPHTSRTWRTPIPRSHLAMPGVPSIGRTSMIAGASIAMSNLYCRTGKGKFAEKARGQPVKKRAAGLKLQEQFGIGEREQGIGLSHRSRSNEKGPDARYVRPLVLIRLVNPNSNGLLRHLTADFAARIGRGVDVDVVLARGEIGRLSVRQRRVAFGGA
jgi:hypothetical protein